MKKWENADLIQLNIKKTASGEPNSKTENEHASANAYTHAHDNSALFGGSSTTTSDNTDSDLTDSQS